MKEIKKAFISLISLLVLSGCAFGPGSGDYKVAITEGVYFIRVNSKETSLYRGTEDYIGTAIIPDAIQKVNWDDDFLIAKSKRYASGSYETVEEENYWIYDIQKK